MQTTSPPPAHQGLHCDPISFYSLISLHTDANSFLKGIHIRKCGTHFWVIHEMILDDKNLCKWHRSLKSASYELVRLASWTLGTWFLHRRSPHKRQCTKSQDIRNSKGTGETWSEKNYQQNLLPAKIVRYIVDLLTSWASFITPSTKTPMRAEWKSG